MMVVLECSLTGLDEEMKRSPMTHLRSVSLTAYQCLAVHYIACSGRTCTYQKYTF